MTQIIYNGNLENLNNEIPENQIKQGDYVFCKATNGANSFWGIYSQALQAVISLDGAGNEYIYKLNRIYLGSTYGYWTITKRIKGNNVRLTIEEIY